MKFSQALLALTSVAFWYLTHASAAPTHLVSQPPVEVKVVEPGVVLVDFGRVAFGNIALNVPADAQGEITVRFGEALKDGRVNRKPGATIRYSEVKAQLRGGEVVVAPPADKRNTTKPAILTPLEWGVVTPFRWVEIEGWPGELPAAQITRRAAFSKTWDDAAAGFRCSDETLNRIWELCRYSIQATTFAGVYVDGDRERIPYEADAYLNQLSHYACDADGQMARDTFDYLIKFPTWPTEWAPHFIFIAHADWGRTGDAPWLAARYESLKPKLLGERARADGLLASTDAQIKRGDIVDWPVGERDGFEFKPVNSVVNAFHLRALTRGVEDAHFDAARAGPRQGGAGEPHVGCVAGEIADEDRRGGAFDIEPGGDGKRAAGCDSRVHFRECGEGAQGVEVFQRHALPGEDAEAASLAVKKIRGIQRRILQLDERRRDERRPFRPGHLVGKPLPRLGRARSRDAAPRISRQIIPLIEMVLGGRETFTARAVVL